MNNTVYKKQNDDRGLSLIELIIVIAIMGVLTGIMTPLFIKYVDRTKKSRDVYTADQIARAVNVAFIEHPEAYDTFCSWTGLTKDVKVTVNGKVQNYKVHLVASSGQQSASNMKSNCFNGTTPEFMKEGKNPGSKDGSTGFYGVINRELGLSTTEINSEIIPRYVAEGIVHKGVLEYCDRYRIVKRKDNGMMEIWVAQPDPAGGHPIYRVWPEPDDAYRR